MWHQDELGRSCSNVAQGRVKSLCRDRPKLNRDRPKSRSMTKSAQDRPMFSKVGAESTKLSGLREERLDYAKTKKYASPKLQGPCSSLNNTAPKWLCSGRVTDHQSVLAERLFAEQHCSELIQECSKPCLRRCVCAQAPCSAIRIRPCRPS